MATRYVWEKWNIQQGLINSGNTTLRFSGYQDDSLTYYTSNSYSIYGNTVSLSNPTQNIWEYYMAFTAPNVDSWFATTRTYNDRIYRWTNSTTAQQTQSSQTYKITLTISNIDVYFVANIRGTTSYGLLSSASASAYPDNSQSDSYWYVLQGNDTIDPSAITYDESTLVAGETVTVTISPSTGNTYGGTITYQVEVNVDETGWEVVTQTTSTSVNLDIPADAVSWRVRVLASDDMGFTSTDYVYGNNATEVPSTVIYPSVFAVMPEDKNLGFIGNSKILTYLVTTDNDADYNIVATLNEVQVYSATESSGAKALTLSDDIWKELSSDELHTLVLTVTQGEDTIVRTYKFKKFVYDYTYLAGLLNGTARAIRVKRGINKQITAVNFPKEILKISQIKEEITNSYIDVSIPYVAGGTVVATYANGDIYGADLDSSGVTRVTVDHKGFYTLRAYAGNSPSSSASVTIENDGDTVSTALQWIKLTVTVESGATVTAVCGEYSVSGTSNSTVDLYLPATGTYTVTASKSSYSFTVSDTVQVTGYNNYTLSMEFINPDFGANSWATIQAVVQAGKAASYWSVGDMKAVTLNGDVG